MVEAKLVGGRAAKFGSSESFHGGDERLSPLRRLESRQRDMRMEFARFRRQCPRVELRSIAPASAASAGSASMPAQKTRGRRALGKKPRPAKRSIDGGKPGRLPSASRISSTRLAANLADEFQRDVHAFEAHPTRAAAGFLEARGHSASASRTSGISRATKRRTGLALHRRTAGRACAWRAWRK